MAKNKETRPMLTIPKQDIMDILSYARTAKAHVSRTFPDNCETMTPHIQSFLTTIVNISENLLAYRELLKQYSSAAPKKHAPKKKRPGPRRKV